MAERVEEVSDERLADCIEVARQNYELAAEHGHGRTRIYYDTHSALIELQEFRAQRRRQMQEG